MGEIRNILTIAGTDPSGGAGIQADLKTFSALGGYGTSVITALVAQNTQGVAEVLRIPPAFVAAQLRNLLADVRIDAVKIGMLGSRDVIEAVAGVLGEHPLPYVVLDPVMVAKSGHRLLAADAVSALRTDLLPLADLVTPNLPEAADLTEQPEPVDREQMANLAGRLLELGPGAVLLKGGHLPGEICPDLLLTRRVSSQRVSSDRVLSDRAEPGVRPGAVAGGLGERECHWLEAPRVDTRSTHGTGCTLSAAVATLLPQLDGDLPAAVRAAKAYLTGALRASGQLSVGGPGGHGPVHHFYRQWNSDRQPDSAQWNDATIHMSE
ncbi:bifunctional hydroxymethylpyrimidine kinase/phosphomethylpyrimidine kinase [Saxibacter everestensis]|uniref:Bifunctional hydroxymethylpyrimidine kinase/phosphomethylpyrimidine kinase n=1 Tax=Saxibacter everestensis TaxID=2909229 RepID=A0ABY8QQA2_9MICO|nr:bifunctional hydroxymethylpyrimidine kinase/phosphomethylpyrimidine kinase [Brevibacteriaceae bacterium ZFBP1038]